MITIKFIVSDGTYSNLFIYKGHASPSLKELMDETTRSISFNGTPLKNRDFCVDELSVYAYNDFFTVRYK